MSTTLAEAIAMHALVSDGAMGTALQQLGLPPGECGDLWNVTHPDRVVQVQRGYVAAGSDILITNTFGASRPMLARHGQEEQVDAINRAGVAVARRAFGERSGFVLGDVGPFGGMLEPYGDATVAGVRAAFTEQVASLIAAGVDGVIVETQTALEEAEIAVAAALEGGAEFVLVSFAYDVRRDGTDLATMMGVTPEAAAEFARAAGAHAVGVNCGTGVDVSWAVRVTERYRAVCDLPVIAQPNAGRPELEGTAVVYRETPEQMAENVPALLAAGARIVGACCGSTPQHIAAIREKLDAARAADR